MKTGLNRSLHQFETVACLSKHSNCKLFKCTSTQILAAEEIASRWLAQDNNSKNYSDKGALAKSRH